MRLILIFCITFGLAYAEEQKKETRKIQLIIGESIITTVKKPKTIVIGDPNVVSVKTISDEEILVSGKTKGLTTIIIRAQEGEEETIQVNVLESRPEKQMIEINVQVYEIQKTNLGNFGIEWEDTIKALSFGEETIPPLFNIGTMQRLQKFEATINLLVKKGYAKLLAKPRLLTVSGGKATFLSGGEVPTVYQDAQRVIIEYKQYGIGLEIQPSADEKGNINTDLSAEVSNIDSANAVSIGNAQIPALRTRKVKTSISVKKGTTIVIAGLIETQESKNTTGIPIISDLPLIGELFKSTHTETKDTELVIFVSPSIVGEAK